jgi:hypothetical protein
MTRTSRRRSAKKKANSEANRGARLGPTDPGCHIGKPAGMNEGRPLTLEQVDAIVVNPK